MRRNAAIGDAESWRKFQGLFDACWFNTGNTRNATSSPHISVQTARQTLWQDHLGQNDADGAEVESAPSTAADEAERINGRLIATRTDNVH